MSADINAYRNGWVSVKINRVANPGGYEVAQVTNLRQFRVVSGRAGAWTQSWSKAGQYSTQIGSSMLLGGTVAELQQEGEFWRGAAVAGIVAGANDVAHRIGENILQQRAQNRGPLGKKVDINKLSYDELLLKLREAHQYMDETGENLFFEDVFKPKSFKTPSAMRIIGMSTRSKFFHPNDVRIRISVSLRQEITNTDGDYSFGNAANQFGNSVSRPVNITRGLRIGILNNDNYTNLMTIDILNTSTAAESYMNALRSFILGK